MSYVPIYVKMFKNKFFIIFLFTLIGSIYAESNSAVSVQKRGETQKKTNLNK